MRRGEDSKGVTDLSALFPDEDYRLAMRFDRGRPEDFFAPTPAGAGLLRERRRWLGEEAAEYAAARPEGEALLAEMIDLLRGWTATRGVIDGLGGAAPDLCAELGRRLEPDFLLLAPDGTGTFRLHAGCVCFPSSWSLVEKMGRSLEEIHAPVPGLNTTLARPIAGFLGKMPPGISWLRANWGLSRSPELNQHPHRKLPRLDATVRADEVWLRVEHQSLVALPRTGGVLFGIRVEVTALADVMRELTAVAGLRRALRTMPEDMAAYKGIAPAHQRLLAFLDSAL